MPHHKLALLGFGNIGQALARLLLSKQNELQKKNNITFSVTAIATRSRGNAVDPDGIDLERALELITAGDSIDKLSSSPPPQNSLDLIKTCGADVLFETIPVSYADGQPALDYLKAAIEQGMHAITANKGPVVHGYRKLSQLAKEQGVKFYFESTVMDGAPVFSVFRQLPAANLIAFRGVLNSTTNLILQRMEAGESFEHAVAYAQSVGIAESDPSGDIDGWDSAIKVAALVTVLMDIPLKPDQVQREGIRAISSEQITQAKREGKRWKLICSAARNADTVEAKVSPELISSDSPFYNIAGTTSILEFQTDVLGDLTLIEKDPGPHTTAYGLLADFLNSVKI